MNIPALLRVLLSLAALSIPGILSAQICPVVVRSGDTLTVTEPANATDFQWFRDDVAIPGATGKSIVMADSGRYAVEVYGTSAEVPVTLQAGPGPDTAWVTGYVLNDSLKPLVNVPVRLGGQTVLTSAIGYFFFEVTPIASSRQVISVSKPGYLSSQRAVHLSDTRQAHTVFVLDAEAQPLSFHTVQGIHISNRYMRVHIPEGDLQDAQGDDYAGDVRVYVYGHTPAETSFGHKMPGGDFMGRDTSGNDVSLLSQGFMYAHLEDLSGNPLQLHPDRPATLEFHIPQEQIGALSSVMEVPLWHYDTTQALWIQEASAERIGTMLVGQVSHFSFWNCDAPLPPAFAKGKFYLVCGPDTLVTQSSITMRSGPRTENSAHDGTFFVPVPATAPSPFSFSVGADVFTIPAPAPGQIYDLGNLYINGSEYVPAVVANHATMKTSLTLPGTYVIDISAFPPTPYYSYSLNGLNYQTSSRFDGLNSYVTDSAYIKYTGPDCGTGISKVKINKQFSNQFCHATSYSGVFSVADALALEAQGNQTSYILHADNQASLDSLAQIAPQCPCLHEISVKDFTQNTLDFKPGLADLDGLQVLSLQYDPSNLSFSTPATLNTCINITETYISSPAGAYTIPNSIVNLLPRLPNLRWLELNSDFQGLISDSLTACTALTHLSVGPPVGLAPGNIEIPTSGWANLAHLKEVHLSEVLEMPADFGSLPAIEHLSLDNFQDITFPATIGNLGTLRTLVADSGGYILQLPPAFANLSRLEILHLPYSDLESFIFPSGLGSLRELDLRINRLTNDSADFGGLVSLEFLNLDDNNFTEAPPSLANLSQLNTLILLSNNLNSFIYPTGLSNLRDLRLGFNQLAFNSVDLSGLTSLEYLYLNRNLLTALPPSLGGLMNLRSLALQFNQLNTLSTDICNLTNLNILDISANQLNALPACICALKPTVGSNIHLQGNPGSTAMQTQWDNCP
nr:hypothetical protein [uncultured bacterium]